MLTPIKVSLRHALLFGDDTGRSVIVRYDPSEENSVFISSDGEKFFELLVTSKKRDFVDVGMTRGWQSKETGFDERLSVYDPRHDSHHVIRTFTARSITPEMKLDGVSFTIKQCPRQIQVVPIPAERVVTLKRDNRPSLFRSLSGKCVLYPQNWGWDIFFSPDGGKFFQVVQGNIFGSSDQSHQSFSFESPHHGMSFSLLRDTYTVVLDGEVIGRQRFISDRMPEYDDHEKPFISAFAGEFVLNDGVLKKHNLTADDVVRNKPGNIRRLEDGDSTLLVMGGDVLTRSACPSSVTVVRAPVARIPLHLYKLDNGDYVYLSFDKYGSIARYSSSSDSIKLFVGPADNLREVPADDIATYNFGSKIIITTGDGMFSNTPIAGQRGASWKGQRLNWLDTAQFHVVETDDMARVSEVSQETLVINDIPTALSVRKGAKILTELRDALAYLVDHRGQQAVEAFTPRPTFQ